MNDHHSHTKPDTHGHGDEPTVASTADVHGMLVVGEKSVFLSHLPMFDHPNHNIQAILPARFSKLGDDPQATYAADRQGSGERVYTLEPEKFILTELAHHAPGESCFCEFKATIFRGHFERDGEAILPGATVTVENVVHFRTFDPEQAPLDELTYILFGARGEHFLAHLITRPPDFDQILSVQLNSGLVDDLELSRGPELSVPGRANDIRQRLRPGESASVVFTETGRKIELTVVTELYLEEGELGVQFSQEPTPEERAAGF